MNRMLLGGKAFKSVQSLCFYCVLDWLCGLLLLGLNQGATVSMIEVDYSQSTDCLPNWLGDFYVASVHDWIFPLPIFGSESVSGQSSGPESPG